MTQEREQVVVGRARSGDVGAFEEIVRANERLLYNVALRTLRSPEDAADAVQETFLKAYTGLGEFRGDSKLSVWLCRILNNVCIDQLRKRRDTVPLTRDAEDGGGGLIERVLDVPDERFDPAAVIERKDLGERVQAAVELLPPDFKMPLLLREFGGQSYEEISQTLSLDMGTVKTRIYRARKKLCALLSDDGNFSGENPSKNMKGGARA